MRKLVMAMAVAGSLGGCATVGTAPVDIPVTVTNIQNGAVAACGFLPTAATIVALLSANPGIATAAEWISAICSAVQPKALKGAPMINGVAIHGRFVK